MEKQTIKSVKRYCNNISKIMQLNYVEIYLLLWLSEQMDLEAEVYIGKQTRMDFIKFAEKAGGEKFKYSDNTVRNALQTLKKQELIIPTGKYTQVWINPKYFFIGKNEKRNNLVKLIDRLKDENNKQGSLLQKADEEAQTNKVELESADHS